MPDKTPLKDAAATLDQQMALKAALSAAANLRQVLSDETLILPELKSFRATAALLSIDIHNAAGVPVPGVIARN